LVLDWSSPHWQKYLRANTIFTRFARRRFTGEDIEGLTEDDLPIPDTFLQIYAETKALGEKGENDDGCKGFCFLLSSNPK
jgi:hypothetical protein